MNKKQIGGLIIAAGLFIAVGVSSVLTNTFSERMLADSMEDLPLTIGIYRITYHYEDSQGNVAEKVRTINVTAA